MAERCAALDVEFMQAMLLEAGKIARGHFGRAAACIKPDHSYVTEADVAVQQYLRRRLEEKYPQDGLIGEEEGLRKKPASGSRIWVIDPIDGTAAFVGGLPVWGTAVGLVEGGRPVAGFFHMPVTGDLFLALPQGRVLRNGRPAGLKPAAPFHLESCILTGPRFHLQHAVAPTFPGKFRCLGSTVAHLCYVATGSADAVVVEDVYAWDLAAGMAMILAGGGVVRYADGSDVQIADFLSGVKASAPILAGHPDTVARLAGIILPARG